jgi:translocator protein
MSPLHSPTADRVRSLAVLVTAAAQILSSPLTTLALGPSSNTGAISDDYRSPVTPAGYAFAIWGVIYLLSLILAVHQALPAQRRRAVHRRSGWWLAGAFTASAVWVPIFGLRLIWLSQLVIVGLVVCLWVAVHRMRRSGPAGTRTEQFALRLPATVYLGWALPATAAGFGVTFRSLGMPARAGWVVVVSIALVLAVAAVGAVVMNRNNAAAGFTFTLTWALIAVAVGTYEDAVRTAALVATVAALALLIVRTARSTARGTVLLG